MRKRFLNQKLGKRMSRKAGLHKAKLNVYRANAVPPQPARPVDRVPTKAGKPGR